MEIGIALLLVVGCWSDSVWHCYFSLPLWHQVIRSVGDLPGGLGSHESGTRTIGGSLEYFWSQE